MPIAFRMIALLAVSSLLSGCFSYSSTRTEPVAASTTVTRTTQTTVPTPPQTTTVRTTTY